MVAMYRKIVAIPANNNELSFINSPHTALGFRQYAGNKDLVEDFHIIFPYSYENDWTL